MRSIDWPQVDGQEGVKADLKDSSLGNGAEVMRFPENEGEAGFRKGTFYLGCAHLGIPEDVNLEFRDVGGKNGWTVPTRSEHR